MRTFTILLALAGSLLGSPLAYAQAPTRPPVTCARPSARYFAYRWTMFNEGNNVHFLPLIAYATQHRIDRSHARWWEGLFRSVIQGALERTAHEERIERDPVTEADDSDAGATVTGVTVGRLAEYPRYVLERANVPWREVCRIRSNAPDLAHIPRTRLYEALEIRVYRRGEVMPPPWLELIENAMDAPSIPRDRISFSWLINVRTDMTLDL